MRQFLRSILPWISIATFGLSSLPVCGAEAVALVAATAPRERTSLDAGWRFAFGNATNPEKDFHHGSAYFSYFAKAGFGDGPAALKFNDRNWRLLDLPHDWAVEAPFVSTGGFSHGYRAVGGAFTDANVGWYRKNLSIPASDLGRRIRIVFDGVFRDSKVWLNGFYLGREPSGYTGFSYDLSDYINYGGENVISVRVDATMEEGWYYEGAGIYRHTWLEKTDRLHVAENGTFITPEVGETAAAVTVKTSLVNEGFSAATVQVEQSVLDPRGNAVGRAERREISLSPGPATDLSTSITVPQPALWSIEQPNLYRLTTILRNAGRVVDRYESTFGIRTVRFDPNAGFFLNGQHLVLKGTNNHQDHAGVGVALPDGLQDYRIARLKEMGSNAYRTSHNPPTPELLEACDRLGMLVIDENRLMGPSPEQLSQLERMIRRDRNHPSVFLWSIGNEEWAIEGNEKGARIAASMQAVVQRLDPTRRVTAAVSGGRVQGISTTIDVMGYNYVAMGNVDEHHAQFPKQPALGTEETTTQATRGVYFDDAAHGQLAPREEGTSRGNCEYGWKYYTARPFLAGVFFWTGFDYRGEPTPCVWPAVSSQFGILDTCGYPKDSYYYLKAWWTNQPVVHVFPHWNWPERQGKPIDVTVFSNCEEVELFLNGQSLGRKKMEQNGHLAWNVSYAPGTLFARGYRSGREIAADSVTTTGPAAGVRLTSHRKQLVANHQDVAAITVELVDAAGRVVPTADNEVSFSLNGPGKIIGVGNGDPASHEPDQYVEQNTFKNLEGWRANPVGDATVQPYLAAEFDDHAWPEAFAVEEIRARLAAPSRVVFRGHFDLPTIATDAIAHLWLSNFGEEQTVYINGEQAGPPLRQSSDGLDVPLTAHQLRVGRNTVAITASPLQGKVDPEKIRESTGGMFQAISPAGQWKRKAFNGLAQVILQTTGAPGPIRLTAIGDGLMAGSVEISAGAPTDGPHS